MCKDKVEKCVIGVGKEEDKEVEDKEKEVEDKEKEVEDKSSIESYINSVSTSDSIEPKVKGIYSMGKKQKIYASLLVVSLSVCVYSGYKYIMNLKDKGTTDKKTEEVIDIGKPEVVEDKNPYLDVDLTSLKEKNADTVGWLKVGAVGIDIPIVQTTDNKYYLDNDIDKKKNSAGWVFVDCKGNLDHMSLNTVIYGHNVRGRHFGLLKKLLESDVNSKDGANIVQLTTSNKQMVFEIVSVYVTNYDDWDYVKTSFASDAEKNNFVNMIKDKNKVEAFQKETLSGSDNYITFSTCHGAIGTDKRLVVHSRLIASRPIPTKEAIK